MQDIDIMLVGEYSNSPTVQDSALDIALKKHKIREDAFVSSLSEEQRNSYYELNTLADELSMEVQLDVVRFMLKFFSSMFNYPKKTD